MTTLADYVLPAIVTSKRVCFTPKKITVTNTGQNVSPWQ
jgi:hypothetical protein